VAREPLWAVSACPSAASLSACPYARLKAARLPLCSVSAASLPLLMPYPLPPTHTPSRVEYLPTSASPRSPCPYSGRLFELLITLKEGYPYDAPAAVRCLPDSSGKVPLYHPSVNETTGEFCTGLWDKSWQETWWLSQFGQHLRSHLAQPQEGGENAKASAELMGDLAAFEAKARAACSNLRVEEGSSSSSSSGAAGGGGGSS
jgi:ubiquitin-protein ligase